MTNHSPLAWASTYRRTATGPFTLDDHKPFRQIYDDDHPHIVVMGPANVGKTEFAINRALHALDGGIASGESIQRGLNVLYLLPTMATVCDVSQVRLGKSLRSEHPHLARLFRTTMHFLELKRIGLGYLYLQSASAGRSDPSRSHKVILSVPCDLLIIDGLDVMSGVAVEMARKCMRASPLAHEIDISTPTGPEHGIHKLYLESDQHVWKVPCPGCHAFVEMDFFRDVHGWRAQTDRHPQPYSVWRTWSREALMQARWSVRCPVCRAGLDRFAEGRWVARNPEHTNLRGYHLPALAFPTTRLSDLALQATATDPIATATMMRAGLGLPAHG